MKEKILEGLKNEYKDLGLSKEVLIGVASFLEKTITNEEEISTSIKQTYVSDFLKSQQKEFDRMRGEKSVLQKEYDEYKAKHPEGNPNPNPTPEPPKPQNDEKLAELLNKITNLETKLADADKNALRNEIISKVRETLKTKGCTNEAVRDIIMGKINIADDATIESVESIAEGGVNQYNELYKTLYGNAPVPPSGSGDFSGGYKKGMFSGVVKQLEEQGKIPQETQK